MASPTFFGEGSTPRPKDTLWRISQKILGALVDGGGAGGASIPTGAGAPVAAPTTSPFYADTTTPGGPFVYAYVDGAWQPI